LHFKKKNSNTIYQVKTMKKTGSICLMLLFFSMLLTTTSCKSNKISCPTYSDKPAPTGIPKSGKAKSSVIPPDYKKK